MNERWRILHSLLRGELLLLGLLLELHVEEPLVDLDARKACLLHGLPAHLAVPLSSQFVKQSLEVFNLSGSLLLATHLMLDHICWRVCSALLALAFTRDHDHRLWRLLVDRGGALTAVLVAGRHLDGAQVGDKIVALIIWAA